MHTDVRSFVVENERICAVNITHPCFFSTNEEFETLSSIYKGCCEKCFVLCDRLSQLYGAELRLGTNLRSENDKLFWFVGTDYIDIVIQAKT